MLKQSWSISAIAGLLISATLFSGSSTAQDPTFRAAIQTVPVQVAVFDKQGNPVRGLQASDFRVLEDGKLQQIEVFLEADLAKRKQLGALDAGSPTSG